MAEVVTASLRWRTLINSTDTEGAATQTAEALDDNNTSYANGTSDTQVDAAIAKSGTLAAATPVDFDLDSGLTGILGDAQNFADIQAVVIKNTGATNPLDISGDFLGLSTDALTVKAGGQFVIDYGDAGEAIAGSSDDVLTLESTVGTTYELYVIGRTA